MRVAGLCHPESSTMSLLAKRVDQVTESDLESLLASGAPESLVLDYKQQTIGASDTERYEFLADISSFANSSGGEIIFGISETNGIPTQIIGLASSTADKEILRLEQIARSGIRPPLAGVETRSIPLRNGMCAILMRIPKSWTAPHQIGQQGSFRFFGRSSNGKFQLDVDSLRTLFRQGPDLAEKIRSFRAERLGRVISNDTPIQLPDGSKLVVHIVPIDNFSTKTPIDFGPMRQNPRALTALLEFGGSVRINLEGRIALSHRSDGLGRSYAQLFRDGSLEIVEFVERWEVQSYRRILVTDGVRRQRFELAI